MRIPNPLTGVAGQTLVRTGGATGNVGSFGPTRVDSDGTPKMHKGVDLLADVGQPVFAAADGKVVRAGWEDERNHLIGYGKRVTLEHVGGVETRYAHLSGINVIVGDHVREGDVVGWAGRTGNVDGDPSIPTHLHFELRVAGAPVDPYKAIA